jgi:hypothetical protein
MKAEPFTLRPLIGAAPVCWANEPHSSVLPLVIPAVFKRESIPHPLDARLRIAGMTDWNGGFGAGGFVYV